jgi:hypothetical protein
MLLCYFKSTRNVKFILNVKKQQFYINFRLATAEQQTIKTGFKYQIFDLAPGHNKQGTMIWC